MNKNISNILIGDKLNDLPILLAPMSGITDHPTRTMIRKLGVGIVFSEMIASKKIIEKIKAPNFFKNLGVADKGSLTGVQIAGCDPDSMAKSATFLEKEGAQFIDINMGCPSKKVVGGYAGSALMKDIKHATTIIKSVIDATSLPVTLKMRLGWDKDTMTGKNIAVIAEDLGVKLITVHGRTRSQFYKGQANWSAVGEIKKNLSIPLIVNGDIKCFNTAKLALSESEADGFMIGRGILGKPWLLAQLASQFGLSTMPNFICTNWFLSFVSDHYQKLLSFYGAKMGVLCARKHLRWYFEPILLKSDLLRGLLLESDPTLVLKKINHCTYLHDACNNYFHSDAFFASRL